MAIQGTVPVLGGITGSGLYIQVRPILIDNPQGIWQMIYAVRVWKNKAESTARDGVRVPCPLVDKFRCDYAPTTDGDPVAFAYNHLKSLSLITNASDI